MPSSSALDRLVARTLMPSFEGPELTPWAGRLLERGLGGICLFGDNVPTPEVTTSLTAAIHHASPDAVVSIDEEGGDVTRLYADSGSPHAGHAVLGAADDKALTMSVAADIGALLKEVGVDLDLGPVADVNSNPSNPVIGVRSFGAEPDLVAEHVAAWVRGVQQAGVGACLKHFPGHGDTVADSHVALPVVEASVDVLGSRELVPFGAGIAAGAVAVMTSHVIIRAVDPERPATFSAKALNLLRAAPADGGLGFDGLVVSDALDMQGASGEIGVPAAAVRALAAGVDLLCLGPRFVQEQVVAVLDAVVAAVRSGELPETRIAEAAARVDAVSQRLAGMREVATGVPGRRQDASTAAAAAALSVDGPLRPVRGAVVLRFVGGGNVAAGRVPWGLPRDGAVRAGGPQVDLREGDADPELGDGRPVVALVRGAHRYPWVMGSLARLAARRPDLVVVEMGWPGPKRLPGAVVVSARGASAVSGQAVDRLLASGTDQRSEGG